MCFFADHENKQRGRKIYVLSLVGSFTTLIVATGEVNDSMDLVLGVSQF